MADDAKPNFLGIGLAAALGGLAAVIVDLFQKQNASAIYQLTNFVNKATLKFDPSGQFTLPVVGVGGLLLIASILLAYFAEARSARAAFYSGASVLTVLMALVPYQQPLQPEYGTTVRQMSSTQGWQTLTVTPAAYSGAPNWTVDRGRVWRAQASGTLPVVVTVHVKGPVPPKMSGVLYDTVSGRSYQLGYGTPQSRGSDGSTFRFEFVINTGTPKGGRVADLKLRVEAPGYKLATTARSVTQMGAPVEMQVSLQPSKVPGFLQRALERPQY